MRTKQNLTADAEALVRRIMADSFDQHLDPEMLKNVACKVSQAIPRTATPHRKDPARTLEHEAA